MGKTLQDAIKEVAEYDGWERSIGTVISTPRWLSPDDMFSCWTDEYFFNYQKYTTSADALLPVWRKVRASVYKMQPQRDYLGKDDFREMFIYSIEQIGFIILDNNLPEAVIKLAGIIKQLKQK